jgi:hypothetical protein
MSPPGSRAAGPPRGDGPRRGSHGPCASPAGDDAWPDPNRGTAPFRRLQMGHDADKTLGQGVVYLPGETAALLRYARAALSCGKLLTGRLQLFDQLLALPALPDYGVDPEREEDSEQNRDRRNKHPSRPRLGCHQDAPQGQQSRQNQGDRDHPAHLEEAVDLGEHHERGAGCRPG